MTNEKLEKLFALIVQGNIHAIDEYLHTLTVDELRFTFITLGCVHTLTTKIIAIKTFDTSIEKELV